MLNILQAYWDWRDKPKTVYKTDQGCKVKKFGDKWAVKAWLPYHYRDLTCALSWTSGSHWFKCCTASQYEIERRFGKILGLEEDE